MDITDYQEEYLRIIKANIDLDAYIDPESGCVCFKEDGLEVHTTKSQMKRVLYQMSGRGE